MNSDPQLDQSQAPSEKTLAHHKVPSAPEEKTEAARTPAARIIYKKDDQSIEEPYGVPKKLQIITPGILRKHWHNIRRFLKHQIGLTTAEREGIFRLLRLAAYYPKVYPKASQIAENPGCSKRTFWRAIAKLKKMGLITVINRFLIREEAQISNLYVLRKLCLAISRYLHEHSVHFNQAWLKPFLSMPARRFWQAIKKWPWTIGPVATLY